MRMYKFTRMNGYRKLNRKNFQMNKPRKLIMNQIRLLSYN